jgi:hypothetical protein
VIGAGSVSPASKCGAYNARFVASLAAGHAQPVILVSRWSYYADNAQARFPGDAGGASPAEFHARLLASTCALAKAGPTYAVLPTPEFPWWVSRELAHRLIADPHAPDIAMPLAEHLAKHRAVIAVLGEAAQRCGLKLLDPAPILCPAGQCMGSIHHRALYRDEHHFSAYGAALLAPLFRPVFAAAPPHAGAGA